eukprot:TRINITY_DN2562_c0_g1_i1.p1 TRINITY_DN2562_c0_g1~~TRINITY_DN2562_c0_g1_i1.p1  ORF type:complete len:840 (+),score=124.43 TRINITY_DN2562_c0_g1_i1:352-2871(+)
MSVLGLPSSVKGDLLGASVPRDVLCTLAPASLPSSKAKYRGGSENCSSVPAPRPSPSAAISSSLPSVTSLTSLTCGPIQLSTSCVMSSALVPLLPHQRCSSSSSHSSSLQAFGHRTNSSNNCPALNLGMGATGLSGTSATVSAAHTSGEGSCYISAPPSQHSTFVHFSGNDVRQRHKQVLQRHVSKICPSLNKITPRSSSGPSHLPSSSAQLTPVCASSRDTSNVHSSLPASTPLLPGRISGPLSPKQEALDKSTHKTCDGYIPAATTAEPPSMASRSRALAVGIVAAILLSLTPSPFPAVSRFSDQAEAVAISGNLLPWVKRGEETVEQLVSSVKAGKIIDKVVTLFGTSSVVTPENFDKQVNSLLGKGASVASAAESESSKKPRSAWGEVLDAAELLKDLNPFSAGAQEAESIVTRFIVFVEGLVERVAALEVSALVGLGERWLLFFPLAAIPMWWSMQRAQLWKEAEEEASQTRGALKAEASRLRGIRVRRTLERLELKAQLLAILEAPSPRIPSSAAQSASSLDLRMTNGSAVLSPLDRQDVDALLARLVVLSPHLDRRTKEKETNLQQLISSSSILPVSGTSANVAQEDNDGSVVVMAGPVGTSPGASSLLELPTPELKGDWALCYLKPADNSQAASTPSSSSSSSPSTSSQPQSKGLAHQLISSLLSPTSPFALRDVHQDVHVPKKKLRGTGGSGTSAGTENSLLMVAQPEDGLLLEAVRQNSEPELVARSTAVVSLGPLATLQVAIEGKWRTAGKDTSPSDHAVVSLDSVSLRPMQFLGNSLGDNLPPLTINLPPTVQQEVEWETLYLDEDLRINRDGEGGAWYVFRRQGAS